MIYDGAEDPLNWLNHCEQFFRGQRTPTSDRTWLASYHLTGVAQTWYYALEQDEGMPSWDRFKELCIFRLGPAVCGTRLSELARLPFTSTVQEYSDRFNAVLCHACNLLAPQKAELFVGGLPEHIKVDVELRDPQDLQMAMHLARAFERRAQSMTLATTQRGARPLQRPGLPAPPCPALTALAGTGAPLALPAPPTAVGPSAPGHPFRRLTPVEQLERRRQGLCYNCDERPMSAVISASGFSTWSLPITSTTLSSAVAAFPEEATAHEVAPDVAVPPTVSLYAIAGIRTENAMHLHVYVHGHCLLALLDSGSTHNFIDVDLMRCLRLSTAPHPTMRVLVANGDRVTCEGVTRATPARFRFWNALARWLIASSSRRAPVCMMSSTWVC
jgi:hypothetical protein